jgi:hypothetical protein
MEEYNEENSVMNVQDYKLSQHQEYIELFVYSLICFTVPFFLGHAQWIVGIIVNATLVLAALNLKSRMILPIILMPSIAILMRGTMFGTLTISLAIMIPFIWIGNMILVFVFKKMALQKKNNNIMVLFTGAGAKAAFIFISALILYNIGIVPAIFLTAMGLMQFYTALSGGMIALGVHHAKKRMAARVLI